MDFLPDALAPMSAYRQFICYVLSPSETRPGKTDKFPVDHRTGRVPKKGNGGAHDPAIWTDHATAIAAAKRYGDKFGVGFVFTEADPFWFLDIDGCLVDGQWSALSQSLVGMFPGAAVEVSSSGNGLHIFGTGTAPVHGTKNIPHGLEFYTSGRFVALTGTHAQGSASRDFTPILPQLVDNYFPPSAARQDDGEWTVAPVPEWNGITDDDRLIEFACSRQGAAAAFGNKASFRDLWEGNVEVLAKCYPDSGERAYDGSTVDAALAQHLAFYTGKDMARMQRLMERSGLTRAKYERDDYLPRTIRQACAQQDAVFKGREVEPMPAGTIVAATGTAPRATAVTGNTLLDTAQQMALFAGCVYVVDANAVLVPGGKMLKAEQFKVQYGGFSFHMDAANTRTSRDAYEAFTQSQGFRSPRADSTCFRPDCEPGAIMQDGGVTCVNTYWPPSDVTPVQGDVTPFMNHLQKVLPDERDRTILLAYMCACVQHAGTKFQWAPLIQGVEGNGKTFFTTCVAAAVGDQYVFCPSANEIGEKFNAWLFNRILIGVEDIYVTEAKREVLEILKPMITASRLAKRAMQKDQSMHNVVANFIFNSNHKDAIRKTTNDRRFCILYCAQQEAADLTRDGINGPYFRALYRWLNHDGGKSALAHFLASHPIPAEFNPAGDCQRAPTTSSTAQAISEGQGSIEQEVDEAIKTGMQGFCGGWISSHYLDLLLDAKRKRLALNKRKDMLSAMGYVQHPGLVDGRVNNPVLPDGKKSRLYIKVGHDDFYTSGASVIAQAYTTAQMSTLGFNAPLPHGVK